MNTLKQIISEAKKEIQIPFSGFYESDHSYAIESAIERECEYYRDELNAELKTVQDLSWKGYDNKAIEINYAKKYIQLWFDAFKEETGIDLIPDIESMDISSPKEYNFATDRIFVKVNELQLLKALKWARLNCFYKVKKSIEAKFTSRSGFISHYDNDLNAWGKPSGFDHNQWYAILDAIVPEDKVYYHYIDIDLVLNDTGREMVAGIEKHNELVKSERAALLAWNKLCEHGTF